ncbi:MAG: hypothetical protein ACP5UA_04835 [Candidatus Hydrogenedens sp.]
MKKNDFIFFTVSLLYVIAFFVIFIYHILPEKLPTELSYIQTEGDSIKPTGTATDIEKIKSMIQNNQLSDKEALFYKKLQEEGKKNPQKHQQIRNRWRRGKQRDN